MLLVGNEEEEDEAVVLAALPGRAWLEDQQAVGTCGQQPQRHVFSLVGCCLYLCRDLLPLGQALGSTGI